MLSRLAASILTLAIWFSFTATAPRAEAHGGTYVGPGSGIPGGPGTPAPGGGSPSTGGSPTAAVDPSAWQQWWAFHRDTFLNLRSRLAQAPARTEESFFGLSGGLARNDERRPPEVLRTRVVPALLRALERERNPDVLTGAAIALAKISDTKADPDGRVPTALRALLASSNQEVAESAALALGLLAEPAAAGPLADLLDDGEAGRALARTPQIPVRTRAFAAYALGVLGQRTRNTDVRRFVARALCRRLDADAAAPSNDVRVACTLALGLVRIEPEKLAADAPGTSEPWSSRANELRWLRPRLDDVRAPETIRAHLPVALARLGHGGLPEERAELSRRLLGALAPASQDGTLLQQSSAIALGLLLDNDRDELDRAGLGVLQRTAREGGPLARRYALIALARAGARDGASAGAGRDGDSLREMRAFLANELERSNGLLRPWCGIALGVLEHGRRSLGETAGGESLRALHRALEKHPGPQEAGAYALALALAGDTTAREAILAHARTTQDEELQSQACIALGLLDAREAVLPLRSVVAESRLRPLVLRDGSIALALLGDHALVPSLLGWLREAPNSALLAASADALGWVGDARAIEPLCALLDDRAVPDRVRAFASVALGRLCDRELLPWSTGLARDLNWALVPTSLFDPASGAGVLDLF